MAVRHLMWCLLASSFSLRGIQRSPIHRISVFGSFVSFFGSTVAFSSGRGMVTASSASDAGGASDSTPTIWDEDVAHRSQVLRCVVPPLSAASHKGGGGGRVGVLGGSADYTGAPYYVAAAALRTGADLAYVWTAAEAALPLKIYSPELMVSSVYSAGDFRAAQERQRRGRDDNDTLEWTADMEQLVADMVANVVAACQQRRLHALVVGPGLGRDRMVQEATKRIVTELQYEVPLVLDADALFMLSVNGNAQSVFGSCQNTKNGSSSKAQSSGARRRRIILTPNVMEYKRLFENDSYPSWADGLTIIEKGPVDVIHHNGARRECHEPGGLKRSGGIGDVLSGCAGTLLAWQSLLDEDKETGITDSDGNNDEPVLPLVAWTACCFVRRATKRAFQTHRRAMTAPDVLASLGGAIDEMTRGSDDQPG